MKLNCVKCWKIKDQMFPYIPYEDGNITGMICEDCKNSDEHEHEYDVEIIIGDQVEGMQCECGAIPDEDDDADLKNK